MSTDAAPAFRLFLFRHAQAAWATSGMRDFDRELDDGGFADADVIADRLADLRLVPERILCSTARRCRQTADALKRSMSEDLDIRYVDSLYSGGMTVYRDLIAGQPDIASLMVVGHNPVLEELLRELVAPARIGEERPGAYPPAGLAVIDFDRPPAEGDWPFGRLSLWIEPRR
ncbi:SixA phosphatase family protein [Ensifer soli]|uniref:SixA phosphatase family protein n=1 Tax=Ciceribacter sp. sgz301302 TaxID=3342379 RepID=UPI0035B9E1C3